MVKTNSKENDQHPGPVPPELKGLSIIEEMLIARVDPMMKVYIKQGSQRASRGHCINFPQDISSLATNLPKLVQDLIVIIVRKFVEDKKKVINK